MTDVTTGKSSILPAIKQNTWLGTDNNTIYTNKIRLTEKLS